MNTQPFLSPDIQTIDDRLISFFKDGAKMLGLPKSVGEIYGALYASPNPLTMHDIVHRLGISKGSASQGLKMLRTIGAVNIADIGDDRKTYFTAAVELKKIVGGFIREEIQPHLQSGKNTLQSMDAALNKIDDLELREFYSERIDRLGRWEKKANFVLPILRKLLSN